MKLAGTEQDSGSVIDRRRHTRFDVPMAYTGVKIRMSDETAFRRTGHAMDVSEGGVRFEADIPIDPGTSIALQIDLPFMGGRDDIDGPGRAVFVLGNVVWCDTSEPGPAMMALAITRWAREGDRERLLKRFGENVFVRAA